MAEHLEGRPVSLTTYVRGCRCDGCREANRRYKEKYRDTDRSKRTARATTKARMHALSEFRQLHPERWREILTEAREAEGL